MTQAKKPSLTKMILFGGALLVGATVLYFRVVDFDNQGAVLAQIIGGLAQLLSLILVGYGIVLGFREYYSKEAELRLARAENFVSRFNAPEFVRVKSK